MVIGGIRTTSAGSGSRALVRLLPTTIGHPIATDIGRGARRMAGRGLDMSHGDGRRITTGVGSIMTITGPGFRAVNTIDAAVGGDPRSSRSTSHSEMTFAGILSRITIAIRIRATIVTTIETGTTIRDQAIAAGDEMIDMATMEHGVA